MKIKATITTVSLLSVMTFGASAAQLVTADQTQNLQPVGTVSISGVAGAPVDYRSQLSQKADEQGASAYKIIEANTGDSYHITAQLYK
ncbi:peroxide/acid stress response protein YhcN [Pantoea allii]|uniref:Peroxide/acid stress response protein YhcN n=1 Tax=Pantoea allii TaxID=574096 RepID=A0ABS6VKX4_9GAMM|nr:peroxide/acid stress response protein YhcN [Pantoea allii]MBW1216337.1 peroxide/acid stress response protein YhcN [Pantoea allii]MBW1255342.1 peroxide/acid stress response protein YhcN [Pantoea allii]MBW1259954.1 peroxide/acid stress response protein YhcN [Pantoea allii]MBW1263821.1 peroxide/acid stress response protein YhcN [Pantoea allii]MBW1269054.1 peroxide/acid stress response protein YhcN [Pantoea allii]